MTLKSRLIPNACEVTLIFALRHGRDGRLDFFAQRFGRPQQQRATRGLARGACHTRQPLNGVDAVFAIAQLPHHAQAAAQTHPRLAVLAPACQGAPQIRQHCRLHAHIAQGFEQHNALLKQIDRPGIIFLKVGDQSQIV